MVSGGKKINRANYLRVIRVEKQFKGGNYSWDDTNQGNMVFVSSNSFNILLTDCPSEDVIIAADGMHSKKYCVNKFIIS